MPGKTPRHSEEIKRDAVALDRSSGKTVSELARDVGVSPEGLRNWYRQDQAERGSSGRSTSRPPAAYASAAAYPGHQPAPAQVGGQQPAGRREQRPVRPVEPRPRVRPAKYGHFMSQHEDLGVQRRPRPGKQNEPREHASEDQIGQSRRHGPRSSPIRAPPSTQATGPVEVKSPYRPRRRLTFRVRSVTRSPRRSVRTRSSTACSSSGRSTVRSRRVRAWSAMTWASFASVLPMPR